ncbi:MAG: DegQ family serine endoprotease [Methylococcaceae bacterium]|nr:MAG: DegQ family serine endoprotease [Methylococcaceae bacterium]
MLATLQPTGRWTKIILTALLASTLATAHAAWPESVDGAPLPSLAPMLKRAMPAVVNISTKTEIEVAQHPLMRDPFFRHFFELPNQPLKRKTSSLGSGVIINAAKGYLITNNHVIDKADEITVKLQDGRLLPAKLVGADPESDLAVIQVEANNLTELPFANSDQLNVGDFVVAIGNPFGLGQTVTSGIVSALGRSGLGIEGYEDFIQTDASINPGNSGGALVNLRGELIGVNTAILAPNGGNVGIGFAIPINMVAGIMDSLIKHGEIRRGLMGVMVQDITPDLAQAFGLQQTQGAVISHVQPDSPAAKAGLEQGDVVIAINGRAAKNGMDVRNVVGMSQIGDELEIELIRHGDTMTRTVTIAKPKKISEDGRKIHPKLAGTVLAPVAARDGSQGVVIEKLNTSALAAVAGLRPGDVIVAANRQRVNDLDDLAAAARSGKELLLNIQRGGNSFFLVLR